MRKGESAEQLRARLEGIDPYEFEHFVADLWEDRGWETMVSSGSRDQGVDIEARKNDGLVDQKAVIQAKRYSKGNTVNRDEVQQYHSMKVQDPNADVAVVVTTSEFSDGARLWAMENNIKLVDGGDIVDMIRKHNRYDLLDEYAPVQDSGVKPNPPTPEPEPEPDPTPAETNTSKDRKHPAHTDYYVFALGSFYAQVAGFVLMFFPSYVPILSESALAGIGVLGLFAAPIAVFADANELHLKGASYRPNRILWPAFTFMIPVIGILFYVKKRSSMAS